MMTTMSRVVMTISRRNKSGDCYLHKLRHVFFSEAFWTENIRGVGISVHPSVF
jgi:hypothetical protein